jgi:hypothetical protein
MISPAVNRSCFVYGTLMSSDVLRILLGRVPNMVRSAQLSLSCYLQLANYYRHHNIHGIDVHY